MAMEEPNPPIGETDGLLAEIMTNDLDTLPALSSKIVRIFTSSTFTDMTLERNALMQNVYPKIKDYCREKHGLEFQVVDMRWGVRDEATDDHMTTDLCLNEIDNCQRLSTGPNFCVFLGQKYGYRPIPTFIPADEFELLRKVIEEQSVDDVMLLDQWYRQDTNSVPPVYGLQPISSILTNFNNKRHQRLMKKDQTTWWEKMGHLQRMLRTAAVVLQSTGLLSKEERHNYFMSVTEREIRRGILCAKDPENHCLAYIRTIDKVNLGSVRSAFNFVDMVSKDVDKEAATLLSVLRDELLPGSLDAANIARFGVEWSGNDGLGVDTHGEYISKFCKKFYEDVLDLVDRAVEKNTRLANDRLFSEVLQHLHACRSSCKIFQGREEVVDRIRRYIGGDSAQPLLLCGESGCGKTSLLAKGYSQVRTWIGSSSQPSMILRFLGTTADSSSLIPLLTSVCQQIGTYYGQPNDPIPSVVSTLVTHFKTLLELATEERPLVLFLDSLDQLSGEHRAHQLTWLPSALPPWCKIVVSTLPKHEGILDSFIKLTDSSDNVVHVTPLGENLGRYIMKSWLADAKRTVTEDQWKIVHQALEKCNLPLYVKLVFDEIIHWKSYQPLTSTVLAHDIHDCIMKLFDHIESQHGRILVSHALGYITASKGGLSGAELEDLLSLDEKVLNDVYQYHVPPVRRIPPLLWTRIRNDLPNYFSEREADGVTVINWYHRQFLEASKERYFRNMNFVEETHSLMADYFLGKWGGSVEKPFQYSELQRQRFGLESSHGACDRKVPEQPLYFTDQTTGKIIRYNLRMLSELPYHLMRAHRIDELYQEVLFNFNWLHAKLSCMPLQTVLADFEDLLRLELDSDLKDVKLLVDALRLSTSVLSSYPDMLGPQVLGRLLPCYHGCAKIQSLLRQCDSDGLAVNALVPFYHCLHTPGGPLQYSLEGHPFAPFGVDVTSDAKYLVSVSSIFIIWHITTGDIFRQVEPKVQGIMQSLAVSPDDKHAVSYTNNSQVLVCDILTGEYKLVKNVAKDNDDILGIGVNNTHLVIWTSQEWRCFTLSGTFVTNGVLCPYDEISLIHVELSATTFEKRYIVWKVMNPIPGVETDEDMTMQIHTPHGGSLDFMFHSAIALSRNWKVVFACMAICDYDIVCYQRKICNGKDGWRLVGTIGHNSDRIYSLNLSDDQRFLVAMVAGGYKLWTLKDVSLKELRLPDGVRNIPSKICLNNPIVVTRDGRYVVAAVRHNLFAWETENGNMVKCLDAHFGRIMGLQVVATNQIISSSIDKSIRVWNFDNILEDVHTIDRMEKRIEGLTVSADGKIGATTTRSCIGIWNLETGKVTGRLATGQHHSKVTDSIITPDGRFVVSAETKSLHIWEVSTGKLLNSIVQDEVQQLLMSSNDEEESVIVVSRLDVALLGTLKCMKLSVPNGKILFQLEYYIPKSGKFVNTVLISSTQFFVCVGSSDSKNTAAAGETLLVFDGTTGTHLFVFPLRYPNFKELHRIVVVPGSKRSQIATIDDDKGNLIDLKKKAFVRSVNRWNGICDRSGQLGLYAPERGGLELLSLRTGNTIQVLIPRIAEGVFSTITLFANDDRHLVYYHSGRKSIRLFRVGDGKLIADYKAHADIRAIVNCGSIIVLGAVDGTVVVLAIADPEDDSSVSLLSIPSRKIPLQGGLPKLSTASSPG